MLDVGCLLSFESNQKFCPGALFEALLFRALLTVMDVRETKTVLSASHRLQNTFVEAIMALDHI